MKVSFKFKLVFTCFILCLLMQLKTFGQSATPGLIFVPATGSSVLDPNGDGFVSSSSNGFVTNDVTESEIPYVAVLPLFPEPSGDPLRGPACGFTDLVDANGSGLYTYLSPANNLMFRFRIGSSIPGSKGYSILIDTDGKIGNSGANADPNYIGGVKGNPGFEVEIVLETNFRVALYDVDGTTTPVLKTSLSLSQYSHKAIALSTICSDPDYFYDFYVPFSVITTYFPSFTNTTPVRFLGVTIMAPLDALSGPTSDTYGYPDAGNLNQAWTDIINAQPPICFACLGSGFGICSAAPVINSSIISGATSVIGTSTEANGTKIRLYKNGTLIDSTTVSSGTWTISGLSPALANGDVITAKAQAAGESACLFSNQVTIIASCSAAPTISCMTKKGAQGSGPAGAPVGTIIKGYRLSPTGIVLDFTSSTVAGNTWLFDCSGGASGCSGGVNCLANETYFVTATEPGLCESDASAFFDLTCGTTSVSPVVTTTPVYNFTTTINGTSATATGTVYMFINGTYYGSATIAASNWSFSSLALNTGDTLSFSKVEGTNCASAFTTVYVTCQTSIPTINTPVSNNSTSVSGTSTEAAGTVVTVYKNGLSIGTTTVLSNGSWTLPGISPALATGNTIYVRQQSSACGISTASPTATVVASTLPPVITGTYMEQGSSVSGTSTSPSGTLISVYLDGQLIGTTTVTGSGTWSLNSLDTTILYAGGLLSATAQEPGMGISNTSNLVTVQCLPPLATISVTGVTPYICRNDSAVVQITGSQNMVIYTAVNQAANTTLSTSQLGNGLSLTVLVFPLSSSQWVKVRGEKIGAQTCSVLLNDSVFITVNNFPDSTLSVSGTAAVCSGNTAAVTISNSQPGIRYQLRDSVTYANSGSAVAGNGGTITLNTTALTSSQTFYVWAVDTTTSANCSSALTSYIHVDVSAAVLSNAGSDQQLCNQSSTTFSGNNAAPGTGTWTLQSGPNSPTITSLNSASSTVTGLIPGVYTFRWTIVNGACTETDDVQITIFATTTTAAAGSDQDVCNMTSASLGGNIPLNGSGNWTQVSGPNTAGIAAPNSPGTAVTGLIQGSYVFKWKISNAVCNSDSDIVQINVFNLPTTADAGTDQNLCNVTSATLNGNIPINGTGNWSLISGPNVPSITSASSPGTTVTGMTAGVYIFRWTVSNGSCTPSSNDVQITIYGLPSTSSAGTDQQLCNVTSVVLDGSSPVTGTGVWSQVSGPNSPSINSNSDPAAILSGMIQGIYVYRWTISNGVCSSSQDDVQITIYASPTVATTGVDQSLCSVNTTTINANTPANGSGIWSFISGPNTPSIAAPTSSLTSLNGLTPGEYIFRWTISNGICTSSTDDITVSIYSTPTISTAGSDQQICNSNSAMLSANSATSGFGSWSLITGPNSPVITSINDSATTVTNLIAGVYTFRWTISNGACTASSDDVQITIYNLPTTANAGADQQICNFSAATLSANTPLTGTGSWTLLSGPNSPFMTSPGSPNCSLLGLDQGTYILQWSISNGTCSTSVDTMSLDVYDLPSTANAGADQNLCNVNNFNLNATIPASGIGTWSFDSGPSTPSINDPSDPLSQVNGVIPGIYKFRWTVNNGSCTASTDSVLITIYSAVVTIDAGPDQQICNSSSAVMSGNIPVSGTGTWTIISGPGSPVFADANNPATAVDSLQSGTYAFGWTIENGVCTSSTDTVIINVYSLPTIADAGPDQSLCSTTTTNLLGNTAVTGTGNWTFVSGPSTPVFDDSTNASCTINNLQTGTYIFRWTISNGSCSSSFDDVQITIYAVALSSDAGPDQQVCNIFNLTMNGNVPSPGTGVWTYLNGPTTPVFSDINDPATQISNLSAGIYALSWTLSNGVCTSLEDSVILTIDALPSTASCSADLILCDANNSALNASVPASGNGMWTLYSGPNTPVIANAGSASTIVSALIPGSYIFLWTVSNGVCTASVDSISILNTSKPLIADAGPDQEECNVTSVTLEADDVTPDNGWWTLVSGPNIPSITDTTYWNTNVTGMIAGTYVFRWTVSNNVCANTSNDVQIKINALPSPANAGPDQQLCNQFTGTFNAAAPVDGAGNWTEISGPSSVTFTQSNSYNSQVNGLSAGDYTFVWTVTSGNCNANSDTVLFSISIPATIANAGIDQQLCNASLISLTGNGASSGTGNWNIITGPAGGNFSSSTSPVTSYNNAVPGNYSFTWTISSGTCTTNIDTVNVTINALADIAASGTDQFFCNTTSCIVNGNTPVNGTGNWSILSGPSGAVFSSTSDPQATLSNLSAGLYELVWTIASGICQSESDTTQITISNFPDNSNAGTDINLCNIQSVTLNGNIPNSGSGLWSFISGPVVPSINSDSIADAVIGNLTGGSYTYTWTINSGICSANIDTVLIQIDALPSNALCGVDQTLCNVQTITLSANAPMAGTGNWTLQSGPGNPVISSPSSAVTTVDSIIPGDYTFTWTISNGICSSTSDNIVFTINDNSIVADAGPDQVYCSVPSVTLNANATANGFWNIISGDINAQISDPQSGTTTLTGVQPGTYVVQWSVTNGACYSSDDATIIIRTSPDVSVNDNLIESCDGQPVSLYANGASSFIWTPASYLNSTNIADPVATPKNNIVYIVTGTDQYGCTASDSVTVEVCTDFFIPTGFSPDGDGVNDFFEIPGIEAYPDNELHVFNRWGNLVYEKENYDNSWDGTCNRGAIKIGEGKVPHGTYYFVFDTGTNEKSKTGYLIIKY
jgi:gliding motility-associated-like protein